MGEGRSLAETPTWSVATVTTVMVAVCFLVERSIYRFGKWLKKTKRKAMLAALEKIREELMLLGLISLMLSQTARWISEICVPSSLFSSRFYICSENDFEDLFAAAGSSDQMGASNRSTAAEMGNPLLGVLANHCSEGYEPFVSFEGLEQLHRFLFILGITHVLYSFITVVLSMIKIYSWRKWESQAYPLSTEDLQAKRNRMMKRQSTFVFHHASHPWSKNKILIWMLCFIRQFKGSIAKSDYMALRLGFITNAFEMATFIWSLWDLSAQSCFTKNHFMVVVRLILGLLVQFWCSYSTLPLNVIISQMGSKFKKSLIAESVRESLHSWCRRVKEKSKRDPVLSRLGTTTSTISLGSTVDETDETNTIGSGTLSRCSSRASMEELVADPSDEQKESQTPHL
ncbi:MLO-like protein 4 [Canna indica]|uniref:MLO-like protein 4 n=1 Tax=Canna indica TaxID=4628 RepID=A0AAQ3KQC4_9LILI|nr:MLO-like protein 4 [Canna indica]